MARLLFPLLLGVGSLASKSAQTQVDLTPFLNNKAAALTGSTTANFDNYNGSYPAEYLPTGTLVDAAIAYKLPNWSAPTGVNDNINCSGQTIKLPRGRYHSFNFLGATDGISYVNGEFFALYEGGETESLGFVVAPWWLKNPSDGPITAPFLNEGDANGTHRNWNITRMFTFQHHLDNSKVLTGLILPNQTGSSQLTGVVSIHVFAITLSYLGNSTEPDSGPILNAENVRSTTKFRTALVDDTETQIQLIEITLSNLAISDESSDTSTWLTNPIEISLASDSVQTVVPATLNRLRGGDQVRVVVGVVNNPGVEPGTQADGAQILIRPSNGSEWKTFEGVWNITAGIPEYFIGDESLRTHESAEWFDGVKFGLFVHWGPYSVPAYTLSGTQYAEWYWYWQHNPANESSRVWTYHKETYGEDFLYDMFFDELTGTEWSAEGWLQFVRDSGAKYYVFTTKHHDGFAMFDTGSSSNRNSLKYGPKRDFVAELLNATKSHNERNPEEHIYHGLYFSLPEWFNPAFAKYGHAGGGDDLYHRRSSDPNNPGYSILQRTGFAGGLARNAYDGSVFEPYTGYVEVEDYLQDIMKPQMEALMYQYEMDIMWCDVGGPTVFPEIAPAWFNWAKENGRQVLANARCGANYSDFDNPEYSPTSHLKLRKWESSEGSDPYSYGYNRDTPWDKYRNATYILHSLVDIVSKNGNYLLDVGPTGNGSIVPPTKDSLMKVGKWLSFAGDAIYDTQYWYVAAEDGDLRFTTKPDAFYITSLTYPANGTIRSSLPLPVREGDIASFLGTNSDDPAKGAGLEVDWHWTENGVFELFADEGELRKVDDAWAFKIEYASQREA
ncbi:hypothetical protein PQX77_015673 [Marasmius sp. AFHP31]|nr:hypothetical protein PQX77_015673 [Marasmius sp. AFHP31]